MIKLNYELIRDEKDETRTYVLKDFPSEFKNLVYIKGPNGRGKSFILHVIAIALYGNYLSDDEIDPGIKRKLNNLLDLDKNKLTFELEISHPKEDFRLISRKLNKNTRDVEVVILKNGKEIPYPKDRFNKEFRLLYTIPNNPTQQLPQLLSEIKASQAELGSRILEFRNYLEERIRALEKSRDEETLIIARKDRETTSKRKREIEENLWILKEEFEKFEKYFYLNTYLECNSEIRDLHDKLSSIDIEIKDLEKKVTRKSKDDLKSGRKLEQILRSIEKEKDNTMLILAKYRFSDLKQRFSDINSSSVLVEIKKPNFQKTIRENLEAFIKAIESLAKSEEAANATDLTSLELYSSLRKVLNNPRYLGLNIPGTGEDVNFLLTQIENAIIKIDNVQAKINGYHSDIAKIRKLNTNINEGIALYKNNDFKGANFEPSVEEIRLDTLVNNKTLINHQINATNKKKANAKEYLVNLRIDISSAISLETQYKSDQQIQSFAELSFSKQEGKIGSLKRTISNLEHQLNQVTLLLQSQSRRVEELESQDVEPDRVYLSHLKLISRRLVPVESLFRSFLPSSLNRIENQRIETALDEQYSEIIGRYYAKNMHTVLHVDGEYQVRNVDIVNQIITTTSGKEISFEYLSTGQSQSSYLTTKLGMTDTKRTIALFDEVAMMDETSLAPVINLLRSSYQHGKLLGSIIVQRAETPIIEEL